MDNKIFSKELLGKVYDFDGEAGIIITNDKEYVFNKKDIMSDDLLVKGDVVSFRVNHLPFIDEVVEVAKFVKKDNRSLRFK